MSAAIGVSDDVDFGKGIGLDRICRGKKYLLTRIFKSLLKYDKANFLLVRQNSVNQHDPVEEIMKKLVIALTAMMLVAGLAMADDPCPVPENDTCAGALELPMGTTFTVNNCGANNDYDLPLGGDSCTGYPTHGLDLVYYVDLVENQELTVTASTSYDNALYLVTDCSDIVNSCVAGVDEDTLNYTETLVFDAADAPGRYYLILDGYSSFGPFGDWEVTVGGVVATQQTTFDSLKSMYR